MDLPKLGKSFKAAAIGFVPSLFGAGIEDLGRLLAEGDFDRFDWARQSSAGDLSIHAGRVGDARAGPKQHDDRPRSGGIERAVDRPVFVEGGGQARVSKQRRRGRS